MTAILADGVQKIYRGGVHALRGVSLEIAPGEIFGLLGPNGAGKTTLVKILLDLVRPSEGTTSLLGMPSRSPEARRAVGYLPEDHRFPDYLTGETAMEFYGGLSGVAGRDRKEKSARLLGMVGLANAAKRKIRGWSKGMKQRLGLAQALIADPRILFLDEPTDGVDPVGRAEIRGILEEQKRQGRTIFLNSHLLSEVELLCDRVGILNQGQLARLGTVAELTRSEHVVTIATHAPLLPAVIEELSRRVVSLRPLPMGVEVTLTQDAEIDGVVDLLRASGMGIRGLMGKKVSLEQVFLESVVPPTVAAS